MLTKNENKEVHGINYSFQKQAHKFPPLQICEINSGLTNVKFEAWNGSHIRTISKPIFLKFIKNQLSFIAMHPNVIFHHSHLEV